VETLRTSSQLSYFVEIRNVGSVPLNMNGATFTTFDFTFPPVILAPGACMQFFSDLILLPYFVFFGLSI
jgi:hypothetical protein